MKKGWKLLAAGTAVAAVAGVIAYKKHQESYTEIIYDELSADPVEDDFVPVEEIDDGFDFVIEDEEQILFYE